jgi:MFS family permease
MSAKLGKPYAKWIVTISLAIMTAASLGSAFAPNFYILMIARFVMGIGVFSIFLVGVMAVIPFFGMQNMKTLLPKFSVISIAALSIGFPMVLIFWGPIGTLISSYQLAQAYTFVPIFGISALLAAGLLKEAK